MANYLCLSDKQELEGLARHIAARYGLKPSLVCGIIEQESNWNTHAARFEKGWWKRFESGSLDSYLKGHKFPPTKLTEMAERSMSFGLMQVLGQTARERGWSKLTYLNEMTDPEIGIQVGCSVLVFKLKQAKGNVRKALLYYNGGGDKRYPDKVLRRARKYQANKHYWRTKQWKK